MYKEHMCEAAASFHKARVLLLKITQSNVLNDPNQKKRMFFHI